MKTEPSQDDTTTEKPGTEPEATTTTGTNSSEVTVFKCLLF
jgi:hypothetical protein